MQPILMAVYGTLKRGHPLHSYIESAEFVEEIRVPGQIWVNNFEGYPRFRFDPSSEQGVLMEVFKVTPRHVTACARIEMGAGYTIRPYNNMLIWESTDTPGAGAKLLESGVY